MNDKVIDELEALIRAAHTEAQRHVERLEAKASGQPAETISETAAWLNSILGGDAGDALAEPPSDDFARRMAVILSGHAAKAANRR